MQCKTQTSNRLSSSLVKSIISQKGQSWIQCVLSALIEAVRCLMCSTRYVWLRLHKTWSLAFHWQTHFFNRITCPTPLQMVPYYTQVQYQSGTSRSSEQKPAQNQIINRLASSLVRAPSFWSGGHKLGSSGQWNPLCGLTQRANW